MKILLKCYVDTRETNRSSGTEAELRWVKQNKIALCQTALQVLTGRHTYDYAQCLCLWDFPLVITEKITLKNPFNSR